MTHPAEFDVEAREIPASHLLSVRCSRCGARALAAPGREHGAHCADCWDEVRTIPSGVLPYTVPVGYPLGLGTRIPPVREPYPAPEVTSRDGLECPAGTPGAVRALAATASALAWRVETTWARGCLPHATIGRPGRAEDSWAVRGERGGYAFWAVYRGAAWKFVWMRGAALLPFGLGNVTDLRAFLADPRQPAEWFEAIRERERLAVARRKQATKSRPKARKEDGS